MNTAGEKIKHTYLKDQPYIKVSRKDFNVIVAQDVNQLIRPLEYKSRDRNETCAVNTSSERTVIGALPKC